MALFETVLDSNKDRFFTHPLFETFLHLKWMKIKHMFTFQVWLALIFQVVFLTYSLQQYSFLNTIVNEQAIHYITMIFHIFISKACGIFSLVETILIWKFLINGKNHCKSEIAFSLLENMFLNVCYPVLMFIYLLHIFDAHTQRSLCALLIGLSSLYSMETLSKLPKIGIQTMMIKKVALSILSFFKGYGPVFFSFCVMFHILLHDNIAFASLENSFIKVMAMLMGEFDFTVNFIKDLDTPFIAKFIFLMFLVMMALVFMNLLLGLAVSDIDELEKVSKIRMQVVELKTILTIETMLTIFRYV